MMQMKLVIFDMDGVLTDTNPVHYRAWNKVFIEAGYPFDYAVFKEKIEARPRMVGIASVAVGSTLEEQKKMAQKKTDYFLEEIKVELPTMFEDSLSLLKELKQRGIHTAVASSSTFADWLLNQMGKADLFDTIVTGRDVINGKPHPEIFLTAAHRLGIKPQNCIVVEDAKEGVQAGIDAGMYTIGLTRRQESLPNANIQMDSLEGITFEILQRYFNEK